MAGLLPKNQCQIGFYNNPLLAGFPLLTFLKAVFILHLDLNSAAAMLGFGHKSECQSSSLLAVKLGALAIAPLTSALLSPILRNLYQTSSHISFCPTSLPYAPSGLPSISLLLVRYLEIILFGLVFYPKLINFANLTVLLNAMLPFFTAI